MVSSFFRSSIGILLVKAGGTIVNFCVSVLLARTLGASEFGVFAFALSLTMIVAIPIHAGLPTLLVRETSRAVAAKAFGTVILLRKWGAKTIFAYSLVIAFIFGGIAFWGSSWVSNNRFEAVTLGLMALPLLALLLCQGAVLRGLGYIVRGSIVDSLLRPGLQLILIFIAVSVVQVSGGLDAGAAMLILAISAMMAVCVNLGLLWALTRNFDRSFTSVDASEWKASLIKFSVIGGGQIAFAYLDTIVLGLYRDDAEVGNYRVAVQFSMLVIFSLSVINQKLHPMFSRLHQRGQTDELQALVQNSSLVISGLAAIPALLLLTAAGPIIGWLYGPQFGAAVVPLQILVCGQFINATVGSVGALLNMTGNERDAMLGMILAIALNLMLNLILVPEFGMHGAACATSVSLVVWNLILRQFVRKRLGIESSGPVRWLQKKITH